MKTKLGNTIRRIKKAADEFQNHSFTEFQKFLPEYINTRNKLSYAELEDVFSIQTGMSIKNYFNQVKAQKATELFNHYKLSPIEVAYQLGFRTTSSLKKIISLRNRFLQSRVKYSELQRSLLHVVNA